MFYYKDKGSALLAHKLVLTECGLSKSWVVIQEVAKVQAGNEAASLLHSVQGSRYAKLTTSALEMLVTTEASVMTQAIM